jgi:outer membrane protein assembly factor BamA
LLAVAAISSVSSASAQPTQEAAPDQASGVLVPEDGPSGIYWVPRVALFPVRIAAKLVFAPLRGVAWASERYQIPTRLKHLFYSDGETFGIVPTAFFETGLGLNVGAHLTHTDLFGHGEHLSLKAGYGGEYKQRYQASLSSGELCGTTQLKILGSFRAWDRSNFFGIGNSDVSPTTDMLVDAQRDSTAIATRFAQDVVHGELEATTQPHPAVSVGFVGGYTKRELSSNADSGVQTIDRYDEMSLVGFARGTSSFHGQAKVTLSSLSYADRYISKATPSSGWWVSGFAGYTAGIEDDPSRYVRYGVDARRYIDLYRGDRVLVLRADLEGVTAPLDKIPFVDLPSLGGDILRGFDHDRFRDRVAALASAEYRFPVQEGITGFVFADAGRVARTVTGLDVSHAHYGYGGGVQLQTPTSFLVRFQAAGSSDGVFFQLGLDPQANSHTKYRGL